MRKIFIYATLIILCAACESESEVAASRANVSFNFSHSWHGEMITKNDLNTIKFRNENGELLSIERLRYLISNITFTTSNNEILVLSGYNLVDFVNEENLIFIPSGTIPSGNYSNVSFTFGFNNEDNYNNYPDLNSASWSVPAQLGGGYHYMQLEGRFIDNTSTETGYAYHAIRAVDNSGAELQFQDTFFKVNLGAVEITNNTIINVEMDVAEWFKNPNTWDLNVLNTTLMPNFEAQIDMFENGQSVFNLK
ncbi:MAG: MbnP family protein [Jejuia sp.]